MKCKICYKEFEEKEWITAARIWAAKNLTYDPEKALAKNWVRWKPIEELGEDPGRNHKYRCPSCKAEHCKIDKSEHPCQHHNDWIENRVKN